jgi:hypothetical protein
VNAAVGILLFPLAVARAAVDLLEGEPSREVRDRLLVDAGLLGAGLVLGYLLLRLWPILTGNPLRLALGLVPPREWTAAWEAFFGNAWAEGARWGFFLAASAVAGIGWMVAIPGLNPALRGALLRAAVLVAAALAYALFAGALRWVRDNAFHWRYLAPSAVLVHLAAISLIAEPLSRLRKTFAPAFAVALALVPAAALAAAGPPSLGRVRGDLDRVAGGHTADVLAAGCRLVAGEYWTVWPAVWHANLVARERGNGGRIWGISHRSNPTLEQWKALPVEDLRICMAPGEEVEAERWLRAYHLWPVREVAREATVVVLAPAPPLE